MKKLLVICLMLLMAVPSFAALRFGIGIGPGILPPSNVPMIEVNDVNGNMIKTKENLLYSPLSSKDPIPTGTAVADVSYNEIGAPIGIMGGIQGVVSGNNFIIFLSGVYMTTTGGQGDIKATFPNGIPALGLPPATIVKTEIDTSASTLSVTLTAGPKIDISDLTSVYIQLGLGLTSLTLNSKTTISINDLKQDAMSSSREYTGTGLCIPMIIGSQIKLMNNIALGMDAIYISGAALVKSKGKATLLSTVDTTETESVDLTGLSMVVTVKYYF